MYTFQAMKACRGIAVQALKCLALSCARPDHDSCFAVLRAVDCPSSSCIRSTVPYLLDNAGRVVRDDWIAIGERSLEFL